MADVNNIDGNVWYAVTESRVNFSSSLQFTNNLIFATESSIVAEYWQFYKLDNGHWAIRNKAAGIEKQLGTCYVANEIAPSKTQACMTGSQNVTSQEWTIDTSWNDGTYRIQNVGNGTNYNLDVHPGTPVFLSDDLAASPKQPAQHWMLSSKVDINDGAFSTAIGFVRPILFSSFLCFS
jgi:hypothetical protein